MMNKMMYLDQQKWRCILAVIFLLTLALPAEAKDFAVWLQQFKMKAKQQGIQASTIEKAFSEAEFLPKIIDLDRKQPEKRLSFQEYKNAVLSKERLRQAQSLSHQHRHLLKEISTKYHVPAAYIVALWGIETNFGQRMGNFNVISSLSTLAYDGRRSAFFEQELLTLLELLNRHEVSQERLVGSWAGAMGQCQFMPTSFKKYAVDANGDHKKDIWYTQADVFSSIANYLSQVGWDPSISWGREVKVPKSFQRNLSGIEHEKTLQEWHQLGIRKKDGRVLPYSVSGLASLKAALIFPDETSSTAYLVYPNYKTLRDWNRSHYFAITVGIFADFIGGL